MEPGYGRKHQIPNPKPEIRKRQRGELKPLRLSFRFGFGASDLVLQTWCFDSSTSDSRILALAPSRQRQGRLRVVPLRADRDPEPAVAEIDLGDRQVAEPRVGL